MVKTVQYEQFKQWKEHMTVKLSNRPNVDRTDIAQQLIREQIKELLQVPFPKQKSFQQLRNYQEFVQQLIFCDDEDIEFNEEL